MRDSQKFQQPKRYQDLTSDQPYVPDMNGEDRAHVLGKTAPRGGLANYEQRPEESAQRKAQKSKLDEMMSKLDKGEALSDADAEYVMTSTLIMILRESRRPAHHLKAIDQLIKARQLKQFAPRVVEAEDAKPKSNLSLPT